MDEVAHLHGPDLPSNLGLRLVKEQLQNSKHSEYMLWQKLRASLDMHSADTQALLQTALGQAWTRLL